MTVTPVRRPFGDVSTGLRVEAEAGVAALIQLIGDDPTRDGLGRTPARVVQAVLDMCTPAGPDPAALLAVQFDANNVDEMVTVGPIDFTSVCEHHLMPFTGQAWIGYLPTGGKIVGLSKLPRLLDWYASRLQVQERLVQQVTGAISEHLRADAACVIDAAHGCMTNRGAKKSGALMRTTSLTGRFRDQPETRAEFMSMIGPIG